MYVFQPRSRMDWLLRILAFALVLLSLRVLALLLNEYRWYFPADFDQSIFLSSHRFSFHGTYRLAFYCHIVAGPLALVLGSFLMLMRHPRLSVHRWFRRSHRHLGRIQAAVVLLALVPSGWVMALQAYGGWTGRLGFSALVATTGLTMIIAIKSAMNGNIDLHQRWATRCFLCLWSTLLLRVMGGVTVTLELDSVTAYQFTAWASWIIPLVIHLWWINAVGHGWLQRTICCTHMRVTAKCGHGDPILRNDTFTPDHREL